MRKYAFIIVLVFLFFTECEKGDNSMSLCYSNTLISQVNLGDLAVHGLTYNSDCLIYESTEPFVYKKFSYDAQDNIKKVEIAYSFSPFSCVMIPGQSLESDPRKAEVAQYSLFEYDNDSNLIRKSNYFVNIGNPVLTSYQTYDYLGNHVIKSSTYNPQDLLTEYHDFEYDERGNITQDDLYVNNSGIQLVSTIICDFDNKNNPYLIFSGEGIPGEYTNKNNIINETYISYNGDSESRTVRQNVYEYNSLDYPVKINGLDCKYGK